MTKTEVEKILRFYNEIDEQIRTCNAWIKEIEQMYNPVGAMNYDGMPKGSSNGDSTSSIAMKLSETGAGEELKMLNARVKELRKLRTEILREFTSLSVVHKKTIEGFYIKGMNWEQIAKQINYSVRQSKNIRNTALETLAKKMARNNYISRSKILKQFD